jgi:hypothetical protein
VPNFGVNIPLVGSIIFHASNYFDPMVFFPQPMSSDCNIENCSFHIKGHNSWLESSKDALFLALQTRLVYLSNDIESEC